VARLLLENGAQVGRENEDGWTALHFAVSQGHRVPTRLLLDRGADPWSVDVELGGIPGMVSKLGCAVLPLIQLLTWCGKKI